MFYPSEDRFRDKRRSLHATNETNKFEICFIMYDLASFGRKFITDLIHWQLIGSTIPQDIYAKFSALPRRVSHQLIT